MNKIAIITGATSGIGYATTMKFLKEGYDVVALSLDNEEKVNKALDDFKPFGNVTYYSCDISNKERVIEVVDKTIEQYGHIDVLVNNAGIVGHSLGFLDENTIEDTINVVNVNLIGTIQLSYYVAKYMINDHNGVIVNVGSLSGEIVNGVSIGYASSKAAVHMATQVMARDLSPQGIRVVTVAPSCVKTDLLLPQYEEYCSQLEMKKRVIQPEELAGAIYIMTLPEASAINGSLVMADDGYCSFKM